MEIDWILDLSWRVDVLFRAETCDLKRKSYMTFGSSFTGDAVQTTLSWIFYFNFFLNWTTSMARFIHSQTIASMGTSEYLKLHAAESSRSPLGIQHDNAATTKPINIRLIRLTSSFGVASRYHYGPFRQHSESRHIFFSFFFFKSLYPCRGTGQDGLGACFVGVHKDRKSERRRGGCAWARRGGDEKSGTGIRVKTVRIFILFGAAQRRQPDAM